MPEHEALKPCPWCGPGTELKVFDYPAVTDRDTAETYVQCQNCAVMGPHHVVGIPEAIAAWNRRAPSSGGSPVNSGGSPASSGGSGAQVAAFRGDAAEERG